MLFVTIVLDGVGIGEQPDAHVYGDEGSDTLGHVLAQQQPHLPNLESLGLGNIRPLTAVSSVEKSQASWGKMTERSAGKDSTTGHWELAGLHLEHPLPTYPQGFPDDVVASFCNAVGVNGVLGNRPESGTVIIEEFGAEHIASGNPILYTSADSVFQIAAHTEVVSLENLYQMCQVAREAICVGQHGVGRVIARPFTGMSGSFQRLSTKRRDFSRLPEEVCLQEALQAGGVETVSVGKVADLFGGVGFDRTTKTGANTVGIRATLDEIARAAASQSPTFIWVNLIDFDQEYGHRNNPKGFAGSLEEFDQALPSILEALPTDAQLVITADHGNDPTTISTDHSREFVPLLYYVGKFQENHATQNLGVRDTFADHAATVADYFGISYPSMGLSFLSQPPQRASE